MIVGCGPAPWTQDQPDPAETAPAAVPKPVPNDLSSGSTQRELQAGAVAAEVGYWSTLSMDRWTPAAIDRPLHRQPHGEEADDAADGHDGEGGDEGAGRVVGGDPGGGEGPELGEG